MSVQVGEVPYCSSPVGWLRYMPVHVHKVMVPVCPLPEYPRCWKQKGQERKREKQR